MKLPNGYGSVYKLSGTRRKPWAARITDGWENDPVTLKSKQQYKFIGFYESRKEALLALADYNANPYNLEAKTITFAEVYERWSEEHFAEISESAVKGYKAAYLLCASFAHKRFVDITIGDLQAAADKSGKNAPTLKKYKAMLSMIYDYAVLHDIIPKERNKVKFLNIKKAGNPNKRDREPFTKAEIARLWEVHESNVYFTVVLMLIYTGCRISEFLDLKKTDVDLQSKFFDITKSKTEAGIRGVPIADKVLPFFEYWYNLNNCEYLISTPDGKHFEYRNYYDSYFKPLMAQVNMTHKPHDTRHTCVSRLTAAGVDERTIKKIVGHAGQGVTQKTYTHFEMDELLAAVNSI